MILFAYLGVILLAPGTPTSVCNALPPGVNLGDNSFVTCNCPTVTAWQAMSGSISASSPNTAIYTAYGVVPGNVIILAQCQGAAQPESITVTVAAPPAPFAPHIQSLCAVAFDHDKHRPTRVDNEAKACLDQVALVLQRDSSAALLLIGTDAGEGATASKRAQQRAVNTKDYLVRDKGIDGSRIMVRSAQTKQNAVQMGLVPAGANSNIEGLNPIDESKVKPISRYRKDY